MRVLALVLALALVAEAVRDRPGLIRVSRTTEVLDSPTAPVANEFHFVEEGRAGARSRERRGVGEAAAAEEEQVSASNIDPIRVSRTTAVTSHRNEFFGNSTRKAGIWTPDHRMPAKGSDLARAVELAERSFILADCSECETRLSVFYIPKNAKSSSPYAEAIRNGEKGQREMPWNAVCTVDTTPGGIDTDLVAVALEENPGRKLMLARAVVAALYSDCKSMLIHALSPDVKKRDSQYGKAQRELIAARDLGRLRELLPSKNSEASVRDMVETWFNNVDIYFEGADALRQTATIIDGRHRGENISEALWMYIYNADQLVRHGSNGHFNARVMTGEWQGYYEFLSLMQFVKQNETGWSRDKTLLVGLSRFSTEIVRRLGQGKLRAPSADEVEAEEVGEEGKEGEEEMVTVPQSLLEVSAAGPIRLKYSLRDNPGELFSHSLFGAGLGPLVVDVMRVTALRHHDRVSAADSDGNDVPCPCLSKGATVSQKSLFDQLSERNAVCWEHEHFDTEACLWMNQSKAIVHAAYEDNMRWIGTVDPDECRDVLEEVASSWTSMNKELYEIVREDRGVLNSTARNKLKHVVLNHPILHRHAPRPTVTKGEKKAADGLKAAELRVFLREELGARLARRPLDKLGKKEWGLPLLAAFTDMLVDDLRLNEWQGLFHLESLEWTNGAEELFVGITFNRNAAYRAHYEAQSFNVHQRR